MNLNNVDLNAIHYSNCGDIALELAGKKMPKGKA